MTLAIKFDICMGYVAYVICSTKICDFTYLVFINPYKDYCWNYSG